MQTADSTACGPEWRASSGLVPYNEAVETMRARVEKIRSSQAHEQVWLIEHPPLYTSGTSAQISDLADPNRFETFVAGRGGQWTYHGPGQLVAYVMLDLTKPHGTVPARDTHAFVHGLESWLISALAEFGVQGERRRDRVGIWVCDAQTAEESKIAAIGVRITRWVSWHGIALNVCPELEHFSGIVPCGIRDHGVTSLRALGAKATVQDAARALRANWAATFGPFSSAAASLSATRATER